MGVAIARNVISSTIQFGAKLLKTKIPNTDSGVIYTKLFLSAQSGNLQKTSARLSRQYPTFADLISYLINPKHTNLSGTNKAAKVFAEVRKQHPINFKTIG